MGVTVFVLFLLTHRRNMAHFGVKVMCIEPGFFKTSMTNISVISQSMQKLWGRLPQDVKDDYGSDYLDRGNPNTFQNTPFIML